MWIILFNISLGIIKIHYIYRGYSFVFLSSRWIGWHSVWHSWLVYWGSWFSKFSFLYTYWSTGTTGWKQLGMNFMVYFDLLYSQYFNHRSRFGVNIDTMHIRFHDLGDLRYSVAPGAAAAAADERRTLGRCGKSNGFPSPSCGCPFLGSRWSRVKWKPWSIRRWSIPSQKARYGGFPVK